MSDEYVTLEDCKVGQDSNSGQAVYVYFEKLDDPPESDGWIWVPYSQVRQNEGIVRTTKISGDKIAVRGWWARKVGLIE